MDRIGMAQALGLLERNVESAPSRPRLEGFPHRGRLQRPARASEAQKDLPVRTVSRDSFQILTEALPVPVLRVGIRDTCGEIGPYAELVDLYGMGAADIVSATQEAVRRNESRSALRAGPPG